MKKLVYSSIATLLIIGAMAAGVSAATSSLIGKKVQNVVTVTVNGKTVKDAVVIDGTTYAPVRSFSEAAGYSISINKGGVNLNSQTEAEIIEHIQTDHRLSTLRKSVTMWKASLVGYEETAAQARKSIEEANVWNATKPGDVPTMSTTGAQTKLDEAEAAIADLQSKIDAAEAEIKELEVQLNSK